MSGRGSPFEIFVGLVFVTFLALHFVTISKLGSLPAVEESWVKTLEPAMAMLTILITGGLLWILSRMTIGVFEYFSDARPSVRDAAVAATIVFLLTFGIVIPDGTLSGARTLDYIVTATGVSLFPASEVIRIADFTGVSERLGQTVVSG